MAWAVFFPFLWLAPFSINFVKSTSALTFLTIWSSWAWHPSLTVVNATQAQVLTWHSLPSSALLRTIAKGTSLVWQRAGRNITNSKGSTSSAIRTSLASFALPEPAFSTALVTADIPVTRHAGAFVSFLLAALSAKRFFLSSFVSVACLRARVMISLLRSRLTSLRNS